MRAKFLLFLSFTTSVALAAHAGTRMVPPVAVQAMTIVQGNADAAAITELRLQDGCTLVRLDSITRRAPDMDTTPRIQAYGIISPSSAVALHLSSTTPKLDVFSAKECQGAKVLRRIDSIPRVSVSKVVAGTDLVQETPVLARVDSLFVCLDGLCERVLGLKVDNNQPSLPCLVGALPPISRDSAEVWIRSRLASAPTVVDLNRRQLILFNPPTFCPPVIQTTKPLVVAGRSVSLLPDVPKETRLQYFTPWGAYFDLPLKYDWRDSSVDRTLALARPANAGDRHGVDTLRFGVASLRAPEGVIVPEIFVFSTGIQRHVYNGSDQKYSCDDEQWHPIRHAVGDSLLLEGVGLAVRNEGCARPGMDIFAGRYSRWLLAPPDGMTWHQAFEHGALLDNGNAWPIVSDSVLVRGWKIPLATLFPSVSAPQRVANAGAFSVRLEGAFVRVDLPEASRIRIATASGRTLSVRELPAGVSSVALPSGHRGILVVSSGSRAARLFVP